MAAASLGTEASLPVDMPGGREGLEGDTDAQGSARRRSGLAHTSTRRVATPRFPVSKSSLGPPLRDEPGDPVTYRTPAAGALLALVADHVVQGRVVFPGAGYLEMARAACPCVAASGGAGGGAVLSRAFFLFLLERSGSRSGQR